MPSRLSIILGLCVLTAATCGDATETTTTLGTTTTTRSITTTIV